MHLDPVLVPLPGPAHDVEVDTRHSCALVADAVWCWGTPPTHAREHAVMQLETRSLHLSDAQSCATTMLGEWRCWGSTHASPNTHQGIVEQAQLAPVWSSHSPIDDYEPNTDPRARC